MGTHSRVESLSDATTQVTAFWNGLDDSRKRVLSVATIASILALFAVGWWASQPNWTPLTRISEGDARNTVLDQLSVAGVHWRLGEDGQTIEVLASEEKLARKEGAGQHGLVGLRGVDQLDPWITPFQEQLQKQKMLQEELMLQINGIQGIAASRVLLNLKAGSGFIGDEARASASVTVKGDAGSTLSRDVARGIAQLVSHSVAGMTEDEVTVLDQGTGRTLWSSVSANEQGTSSADDASKRGQALAASVTDALAAVLGSPEHVRVSVQVDLDTSSSQSTTNGVDPDTQAPLRERAESDINSSGTTANGAEAGVSSNQPQAAIGTAAATTGGGTNRKREETDNQYQYSTTQVTTVKPAGTIRRVSAAVFINNATIAALAATAKMDEAALRSELEKSAKAALGIDATRGDALIVSFVPFAAPEISDAALVTPYPWERLAPSGVALVAILLTFFLVIRPLLRSVTSAVAAPASRRAAAGALGAPPGEGGADEDDLVDDGKVIDLSERLRRQVEGYKHVSAEDVSELVLRETDLSAEVLRRWIRT